MSPSIRFRIEYNDPATGEPRVVEKEFRGSSGVSAREWAEDYAYSIADKGRAKVTEVP